MVANDDIESSSPGSAEDSCTSRQWAEILSQDALDRSIVDRERKIVLPAGVDGDGGRVGHGDTQALHRLKCSSGARLAAWTSIRACGNAAAAECQRRG